MKRKLADVLYEAANFYLAPGSLLHEPPYEFSCSAVVGALIKSGPVWLSLGMANVPAHDFLMNLGCPTNSWNCFRNFPEGAKRQGVRYLWLLLAMHVAEDEGIEIEVSP